MATAHGDSLVRALLALAPQAGQLHEQELARRISRAVATILDFDGAAVSIPARSTARRLLYATDATAQFVEDLQMTLNEGVWVDAGRTATIIAVSDVAAPAATTRWPTFLGELTTRRTAPTPGARTLVGVPLRWEGDCLGVLGLYRRRPGPVSDALVRRLLVAADAAALLLAGNDLAPTPSFGVESGRGDTVVHRACDVVLTQLDLSADDAVARLRAHAYAHDRMVDDVAADVVAGRLRLPDETPDR